MESACLFAVLVRRTAKVRVANLAVLLACSGKQLFPPFAAWCILYVDHGQCRRCRGVEGGGCRHCNGQRGPRSQGCCRYVYAKRQCLCPPPPKVVNRVSLPKVPPTPESGFSPRSFALLVGGGELFTAIPVMLGVFHPIKGVERLGHPQQFLDAVLCCMQATCRYATGSRSDSAFYRCIFRTSICIVPPSHSFLKLCAFEWLQFRCKPWFAAW